MALMDIGVPARSYTGGQVKVLTDNTFTKARILSIDNSTCVPTSMPARSFVVAGFQGVDADGNITDPRSWRFRYLRRRAGGRAEGRRVPDLHRCRWRLTPPTRASCRKPGSSTPSPSKKCWKWPASAPGAADRSVEFAGKYNVKLRVLSSFQDEGEGTLITVEEDKNMEQPIISGIAFNRDEAKLTMLGVPDPWYRLPDPRRHRRRQHRRRHDHPERRPRRHHRLLLHGQPRRQQGVWASGRSRPNWAPAKSPATTRSARSRLSASACAPPGVASKMFKALADEGINIQMISTSEIKISRSRRKYLELAVRVLHRTFGLDAPDQKARNGYHPRLVVLAAETWPRGRRHSPAKGLAKPASRFESLRLRQQTNIAAPLGRFCFFRGGAEASPHISIFCSRQALIRCSAVTRLKIGRIGVRSRAGDAVVGSGVAGAGMPWQCAA